MFLVFARYFSTTTGAPLRRSFRYRRRRRQSKIDKSTVFKSNAELRRKGPGLFNRRISLIAFWPFLESIRKQFSSKTILNLTGSLQPTRDTHLRMRPTPPLTSSEKMTSPAVVSHSRPFSIVSPITAKWSRCLQGLRRRGMGKGQG